MKAFLPVAAISGSLPWRSASSHWYKATDEPHAERHGAKEKKKEKTDKDGSHVKTNAQRKANESMNETKAWKKHTHMVNVTTEHEL